MLHLSIHQSYNTQHIADKALYQLLLSVILHIYLEAIIYDTLGFGCCTALSILDHLWVKYGLIDDNQLATNLEDIMSLCQLPIPIKTLFTQLKRCKNFLVLGDDNNTDAVKIRLGVAIIEATLFFSTACCKWHKKSNWKGLSELSGTLFPIWKRIQQTCTHGSRK